MRVLASGNFPATALLVRKWVVRRAFQVRARARARARTRAETGAVRPPLSETLALSSLTPARRGVGLSRARRNVRARSARCGARALPAHAARLRADLARRVHARAQRLLELGRNEAEQAAQRRREAGRARARARRRRRRRGARRRRRRARRDRADDREPRAPVSDCSYDNASLAALTARARSALPDARARSPPCRPAQGDDPQLSATAAPTAPAGDAPPRRAPRRVDEIVATVREMRAELRSSSSTPPARPPRSPSCARPCATRAARGAGARARGVRRAAARLLRHAVQHPRPRRELAASRDQTRRAARAAALPNGGTPRTSTFLQRWSARRTHRPECSSRAAARELPGGVLRRVVRLTWRRACGGARGGRAAGAPRGRARSSTSGLGRRHARRRKGLIRARATTIAERPARVPDQNRERRASTSLPSASMRTRGRLLSS